MAARGDVAPTTTDITPSCVRVHNGAVVVDLATARRRRRQQAKAAAFPAELVGFTVRPACAGTCRCWGAPLGGGRP